eukprot:1647344-Amphidinium_carterae.1
MDFNWQNEEPEEDESTTTNWRFELEVTHATDSELLQLVASVSYHLNTEISTNRFRLLSTSPKMILGFEAFLASLAQESGVLTHYVACVAQATWLLVTCRSPCDFCWNAGLHDSSTSGQDISQK